MPIKKTIDDYKEQANIKHNRKYDYSQIIELNTTKIKVNIICPKHGIFEQSFSKHLSGDGCKKCGIDKCANERIKKANVKFIKEASELHNNKYDYSKLNYISAKENIIIICPTHGDFEQTPNTHLRGGGCKKCANEKVKERMSIPWNIYRDDLHKIHDNKYDYSKVIWKGVDIDIIVVCPIHGDFEIRPADHKRGRECQKCSKETHIQYNKLDTENFIEKSIQIWGKEYDYSKTKYIGADEKVIIICNKHGEFEQLPSNHYKYGCASCGREKNVRNNELKEKCKNEFEMKSNIVHDYLYDYTKSDYVNAATKVIVICKKHGEFNISPNNHLRGKGCLYCINKTEYKLFNKLNILYPTLERQFTAIWCKNKTYLPFDFVIPEHKIIIELDGKQHFEKVRNWKTPNEQFENDKYKEKCANENSYSVIRIIQEDVWNDKYDWLKELNKNIIKIINEQCIQNIYICKNNEYSLFTHPPIKLKK